MIFLKRWFAYNKITQGDMHEYQEESIDNVTPVTAFMEKTKRSWHKDNRQKQRSYVRGGEDIAVFDE